MNCWIIHELPSSPDCFEIKPNRDEVMQQIQIFERIQMSLIMR